MKVLICPTSQAAIVRAASMLIEQLRAKPDCVLGFATGATMEPVYAELIKQTKAERLTFSGVKTFNLDEYVGLATKHPRSYHAYMREKLFDQTDIAVLNARLPDGAAPNPHAEAEAYDRHIKDAGGIDLQLLGIGRNGHIGFNEPTSSLGSRTRVKTLTEDTLKANARHFAADEAPPRFAITMGIATILEARRCLLLALGAEKAAAVARMIEGPLSAACPASALQLHPAATIVLDPPAAQALELRDYYELVHPSGSEADMPLAPGYGEV